MKRKWFFSALGLLLIGGMCWMLVGITINIPPKSPLQKLNDARALWQAKGSPNYQMDIAFGSFSYIGGFRLIVHDNKVTEISEFPLLYQNVTPTPLSDLEAKSFQATYFAQTISPDLKQYTVESLFEIASSKVSNDASLIAFCSGTIMPTFPDVRFNSEYGYIESYDLGNCPKWEVGGGLMCPIISDCNMGMHVRHFEILPQSE